MKERVNKIFKIIIKHLPLLIYLLLLIASIILVSNKGGALTYIIFFSFLFYIPAALIEIIYSRFALHIFQDVNERLLYKNQALNYELSISNAGPIPIAGVSFLIDDEITHLSKDITKDEYKLLPGENITLNMDISCKYAGGYDAGITKIIIRDFFGIINFSYDIPSPLRVYVLPSITDIATNDVNRIFEENYAKRSVFKTNIDEISLGNDTRKYIDGDKLSLVHWKNYAKTGEMRTRLYDKQESEMMTVVIIPKNKATIEQKDYMLEYIVSIADCFAKQSKPVRIIYYKTGVKDVLIDNYKSFREFYPDKLKELGNANKEVSDKANDELMLEASKIDGSVAYYYEENMSLSASPL